jgi:hypothetical protein
MASRKAIASISALWDRIYGQTISGDILEIWAEVFEDVSDEELRRALNMTLREWQSTKAPPPGKLYQSVMKIRRNEWPSVGEAWQLAFLAADQCEYLEGAGATKGWGAIHRLPSPVRESMEMLGVMNFVWGDRGDPALRSKWWDIYPTTVEEYVDKPRHGYEALAEETRTLPEIGGDERQVLQAMENR